MPKTEAVRIMGKVDQFATDPASLANNVSRLTNRTGIRLRVGNWRVIMDDGAILEILDVGPRGGIYD